jgi:hypothetical protein
MQNNTAGYSNTCRCRAELLLSTRVGTVTPDDDFASIQENVIQHFPQTYELGRRWT